MMRSSLFDSHYRDSDTSGLAMIIGVENEKYKNEQARTGDQCDGDGGWGLGG
jgi:hypothetical protein